MTIKITQRQAPQFRALLKKKDDGELFDPAVDLATQSELNAEGLADKKPISYTVYKSANDIAPYVTSTAQATPVQGYVDVELPDSVVIPPGDVETLELDHNFRFTPANRATFAFADVGVYFVDVTIFPKTGAAIVFRVPVQVA